jgi:mycothiol synthase
VKGKIFAMTSLSMRRPTLADLPEMPPLPAGYTLRTLQSDELESLARLLADAFHDAEWTPERCYEEFLAEAEFLAEETVKKTFVIAFGGTLVATASVLIQPGKPDTGVLHWVAADANHKGKRLGRIVSLAVLQEFARLGCTDSTLCTDDFRLPAIATYLRLGYVPEYGDESHLERWAKIEAALAGDPGAAGVRHG